MDYDKCFSNYKNSAYTNTKKLGLENPRVLAAFSNANR